MPSKLPLFVKYTFLVSILLMNFNFLWETFKGNSSYRPGQISRLAITDCPTVKSNRALCVCVCMCVKLLHLSVSRGRKHSQFQICGSSLSLSLSFPSPALSDAMSQRTVHWHECHDQRCRVGVSYRTVLSWKHVRNLSKSQRLARLPRVRSKSRSTTPFCRSGER